LKLLEEYARWRRMYEEKGKGVARYYLNKGCDAMERSSTYLGSKIRLSDLV